MVEFEPSTFRATLRGLNDRQKGPQAKEAFPRCTRPALNDRFPGNWGSARSWEKTLDQSPAGIMGIPGILGRDRANGLRIDFAVRESPSL